MMCTSAVLRHYQPGLGIRHSQQPGSDSSTPEAPEPSGPHGSAPLNPNRSTTGPRDCQLKTCHRNGRSGTLLWLPSCSSRASGLYEADQQREAKATGSHEPQAATSHMQQALPTGMGIGRPDGQSWLSGHLLHARALTIPR